ncbi:spermatogenesis associated 6-like protein isoform X3 [Chrysemys picta bellii]|uniref:spermatogenesis associated 6-like protein isoform X3 n=1 Tax=Chrysemys picta bellii TaxID=8478 RepID=UPI0032B1C114
MLKQYKGREPSSFWAGGCRGRTCLGSVCSGPATAPDCAGNQSRPGPGCSLATGGAIQETGPADHREPDISWETPTQTLITCPGVFLPEKHDIYLSVCIMGQYKETECLPPIFPLLFHEKMWFEKVFESAVDPAAVTEMLEMGDSLAFYEENTRDFLFPEPKLTPVYPGVERELLMKTSPSFTGIAPKIEFSTRTTITELPLQYRKQFYQGRNRMRIQRSASVSPRRRSISPARYKTTKKKDNKICKSLTRLLTSRSPSPNATKHLCQFCKENQQQQSRLSLGSVGYKLDAETRPPFVVRHVDSSNPFGEKSSSQLLYRNPKQNVSSAKNSLEFQLKRALSFDSCEASNSSVKVIREPDEQATSEHDSSSLETDELVNYPGSSPTLGDLTFHRTASFATSPHYRSPSPVRSPSPLQHRLYSNPHFSWEKIHKRVQNLLTSNQAKQRLSFGATDSEIDDVLERRSISLRSSPQDDSLEQRYY